MRIIKTSREIFATPENVFAAFTDSNRLSRWWGPEGFTNTFEICEIRPGGKWKFVMHGPDGKNYFNECKFGEIDPPNKFVVKHICAPVFTATFIFDPTENGTFLKWDCEFEDADFVEGARAFLEKANEQNIDRLVKEVRSNKS